MPLDRRVLRMGRRSGFRGIGGGAPWTPLTLAPSLWLAGGASYLTEAGSVGSVTVTQRRDASGNARHVAPGTAPGVASAGPSRLRVTDFKSAGSNYLLTSAQASAILGTGQYYVAVAFRAYKNTSSGTNVYDERPLVQLQSGYWGLSVGTGLRLTHFDTGTYKTTTAIPVSLSVPHVAEGWFDGSAIYAALDGTASAGVAAIGLNAGSQDRLFVLGLGAGTAGTAFDGPIEEVVVIRGATTAAQRTQVRNYLTAKYQAPAAPSGYGNLGRVLYVGDSITQSSQGLTGGWRKDLETLALAAGHSWEAVGPLTTDSGSMIRPGHWGGFGSQTTTATLYIREIISVAQPDRIVWGYGMNDLGNGRAPADFVADYEALLDLSDTYAPNAEHVVQTLIYPTSGAYFAHIANYVAAQPLLAAMVAGRARCTLADVGQPTLSDGYHPIDGAGGYPTMAQPILDALLSTT